MNGDDAEGGEAACLLHRVCAECGAMLEGGASECWRCPKRLLPREVAALYPSAAESYEGHLSVDTEREYRVMGDRRHERGALVRDDGSFAAMDWMPHREPLEMWTTNSLHAIVADATRSAPLYAMTPGITWRHPLALERATLPPGFERTQRGATTVITWGEGAWWMACTAPEPMPSMLVAVSVWVAYSVREIIHSLTEPPGPIGMVPFRRFERISAEEALSTRR